MCISGCNYILNQARENVTVFTLTQKEFNSVFPKIQKTLNFKEIFCNLHFNSIHYEIIIFSLKQIVKTFYESSGKGIYKCN